MAPLLDEVTTLDRLTYAGGAELTRCDDNARHTFVHAQRRCAGERPAVAGVTSSSQSPRRHTSPTIDHGHGEFIRTIVEGTLCDRRGAARGHLRRSSRSPPDEVYGSRRPCVCEPDEELKQPSNPYAASKAGADVSPIAIGRHMKCRYQHASLEQYSGVSLQKGDPLFVTMRSRTFRTALWRRQRTSEWAARRRPCRGRSNDDDGSQRQVYNRGAAIEVIELTSLIASRRASQTGFVIKPVPDRPAMIAALARHDQAARHRLVAPRALRRGPAPHHRLVPSQ